MTPANDRGRGGSVPFIDSHFGGFAIGALHLGDLGLMGVQFLVGASLSVADIGGPFVEFASGQEVGPKGFGGGLGSHQLEAIGRELLVVTASRHSVAGDLSGVRVGGESCDRGRSFRGFVEHGLVAHQSGGGGEALLQHVAHEADP